MTDAKVCHPDNGGDGEDVELGRCLSNLGVIAILDFIFLSDGISGVPSVPLHII